MFRIKEKTDRKRVITNSNEKINYTDRYIVFYDNKAIDTCALRYALLKCCDNVCMLTCDSQMYMSGSNAKRIRDYGVIEVPENYDVFKNTEYEFMLPYVGEAALLFAGIPDKANEFLMIHTFHSSKESEEYLLNSLNMAYDYYNSIYEKVVVPEYEVVIINDVELIRYKSDERVNMVALLSDAQKNSIAANVIRFANDNSIEWHATVLSNGQLEHIENEKNTSFLYDSQIESFVFWYDYKGGKIRISINEYPLLSDFSIYFSKEFENEDTIIKSIMFE